VTQIITINICVRESWSVHFTNYGNK